MADWVSRLIRSNGFHRGPVFFRKLGALRFPLTPENTDRGPGRAGVLGAGIPRISRGVPLAPAEICGRLYSLRCCVPLDAERCVMETEKVITYSAIGVAGIVVLIFMLDLIAGIFGRFVVMDVLFILGGAFLLWQGVETILELR